MKTGPLKYREAPFAYRSAGLELMAQAHGELGSLQVVVEMNACTVGTQGIHVGALRQRVGVAQAVDVLLVLAVSADTVLGIGHHPSGQALAVGTHRSAHAQSVRVVLRIIDGAPA